MTPRSLFRASALQRYTRERAQSVLPRFAFPTFFPFSIFSGLDARRVPVRLQMSAVECGAACLAMILSYYGRETRLADVRERLGAGRDGATARAIAQAARACGLRVKAYSVELAQFPNVQLPAIAHWKFNHFVVVERWSPARVDIVDPAVGRRRLTAEEFDAGFTGVTLTFEPGAHFETHPGGVRRARGGRAWGLYLDGLLRTPGVTGALAQVLAASLLLQLLGLALPALTAALVDQVLPFQARDLLTTIGVGLGLLALTHIALTYARATMLLHLQARLDSRLMLGFFERLLALPFRFFQARTSGDLLMRLSSNLTIREVLTGQTLSAVLDGSLVVVYLLILFWRDAFTGLLASGLGLLQVALLLATRRRMYGLTQQELVAQAESQSYLVEALKGVATLKVAGAEDQALDHWSNLFFKQLNVSLERRRLGAMTETLMTALRTFTPLVLLWLGTARVLDGALSLGTMLGLNALAVAFLSPLASLVSTARQLQLAGAHLERIADVIEAEPEQARAPKSGQPPGQPHAGQPHAGQPHPPYRGAGGLPLRGQIELRDVSFQYDPNSPPVLRGISFTIAPGQKVALVGPTGSGKSTLAHLLLGLYAPTGGQILYGGVPQAALDLRALRRQFGAVLQDPFVFSGAIRQNIALHDPGLPLERVTDAARLAALHDDIARMPMGYETLLAEGGTGLSGGQVQRLALARALAQQPAVLLLDEATSHLDTATEARVAANLSELACTRIVIAHRLSTIRDADLILVLKDGVIVEQGAHDELLALGGHYAELVKRDL